MKTLRSFLAWFILGVSVVLSFPLVLLLWVFTFWWDRKRRLMHKWVSLFLTPFIYSSPFWSIRVLGRENLQVPAVIISNHQSLLDILVLYCLRVHFKWVSKREVFRIPFVGWIMRLSSYIEVRRNNIKSIRRMLQRAEEVLRRGESVLIFPEGTRSADGKIGPFKDGAFHLAADTELPLVPLVIQGTREVVPKGGVTFNSGLEITVSILSPVEAKGSLSGLKENCREKMKEELSRLRTEDAN